MTRPRVAVDGRPLQSVPLGGVGRYLTGTLALVAQHAEVYVLLDARQRTDIALGPGVEPVALSAPVHVPGLAWLDLAVAPWLRRFDGVFHGSFNTLPLTFACRSVLTLHDLAPQLHAEDFSPMTRLAWRLYIRAAVLRARAVTTVSRFIRRQIIEYFGLAPEAVTVAPDALDPRFAPDNAGQAPAVARALGVTPPYFVAVGGAPRRGCEMAIAAWRHARQQLGLDASLAVLGERDLTPEPGLTALGAIDDEAWAALLSGAQGLIYPTRYEGFGLPALEALASGTPVVCSPVASLPEVLGEAACWAPAPTVEGYGRVLAALLHDQAWHAERRAAGLARARNAPTWRDTAAVLLAAYERAASPVSTR